MGEREGMGSGKVREPGLKLGMPNCNGAVRQQAAHKAICADCIQLFLR